MTRLLIIAALGLVAAPAAAAPGGPLGVLLQGRYACETGGDAMAEAGVRQPAMDFSITRGSSYRTETGIGRYLNTGDLVTFTTGPLAGKKMRRVRQNFVRFTNADGSDGEIRCIRRPGSQT